jgi:hypothetical protein
MLKIPYHVKKIFLEQQMIVVSSVDENGMPNISPRTTFTITDDVIYWIELFRHKSFENFQNSDWISVASFDKEKLKGYQLKGKVTMLQDEEKKKNISLQIIDKLTRLHKERILKQLENKVPTIASFKPFIIYSSNPVELTDIPLIIGADPAIESFVGGSHMKSKFGFEIS